MITRWKQDIDGLYKDPDGEWVLYTDYLEVKKELDEVNEILNTIRKMAEIILEEDANYVENFKR